jgi:hypothetical protein
MTAETTAEVEPAALSLRERLLKLPDAVEDIRVAASNAIVKITTLEELEVQIAAYISNQSTRALLRSGPIIMMDIMDIEHKLRRAPQHITEEEDFYV